MKNKVLNMSYRLIYKKIIIKIVSFLIEFTEKQL